MPKTPRSNPSKESQKTKKATGSSKKKRSAKDKVPKGSRKGSRTRMKRVREKILILGGACPFGRELVRRLHRDHDICVVDTIAFPDRPRDVELLSLDLRRKSARTKLFSRHFSVCINLAVHHIGGRRRSTLLDPLVVSEFINWIVESQPRQVLVLSHARLYGSSAQSSRYMDESEPLLIRSDHRLLQNCVGSDLMFQSLFWRAPNTQTLLFRTSMVVGKTLDNWSMLYLRQQTPRTMMGYNPLLQMVHIDDCIHVLENAIEKSLLPSSTGESAILNLTGPGVIPLGRLLKMLQRRPRSRPAFRVKSWLKSLSSGDIHELGDDLLRFLRYSTLVDGSALLRKYPELQLKPMTETIEELLT